jgi:hypothetical protein
MTECGKRHGHDIEYCTLPAGHDAKERSTRRRNVGIKPVSDKREDGVRQWSLIRAAMLIAQKRTDGYYSCMECGVICDSPKQLDLDHLDGDRTNNSPANAGLKCNALSPNGTKNCHDRKHGNQPQWTNERTNA